MIKVDNLTFIYNEKSKFPKTALDDVTFSVKPGEFLGIIGHTGSGKSTLVQHLNALIIPKHGSVVVNNFDLTQKKIDYKALRKGIGMVFQYPEYQLFAETIYDDIAFALRNFFEDKKNKLPVDEVSQQVRDAMQMVGLDYEELKNRSPFDLSGGQKRRVALAGTIVAKPEILILDEPTAGLDPQGKKEILSLINTLREKFVKIVIMISHDMNEIANNCSRVLVLSDGKIAYDSTPDLLFQKSSELTKLNLDIPETVKIAKELNARGFDLSETVFSADILAREIAQKLQHN